MPDHVKYPVTNPAEMEAAVKDAVARGILVDKRAIMPRGKDAYGNVKQWTIRYITDILGVCCHQNAGNSTDPITTAKFFTSPNNSVSPEPLPSVAYHFMIPDTIDPPWYTADVTWKTWAQGASTPGDENLALVSVCIMGNFYAPGYKPSSGKPGPSQRQIDRLQALWNWLKACYGCEDNALFGHFDFRKSACPGTVVQDWIMSLRTHAPRLETDKEWQQALLKWNPNCLPKYGADGIWGSESKSALCMFQRSNRLECTGYQDTFSHLKLYRLLYPTGKPAALKIAAPHPAEHIVLPPEEPQMFCSTCGAELVDGRCPSCVAPIPEPRPPASTSPNPKAKKKG